jgi:quercetin dioxygenase-like cupin family protein
METDHTGGPYSTAYPAGQTHGNPERPMHEVARSSLTFDLAAEVERLQTEESWRQGMRNAKTLVKEPDIRIVVIALRQGGRMEEHRAPGRISIQTLTGRLRLQVRDQTIDLPAGHILMLDPDVTHDVEALDESAFLLTIAWPR